MPTDPLTQELTRAGILVLVVMVGAMSLAGTLCFLWQLASAAWEKWKWRKA